MALSMDLKIHGQLGSARIVPGVTSSASGGGSFSQAFSAAIQAVGGSDYESCFQAAADVYQVPVDLLKAMAKVESNFTADAVSPCGAQGIMQLMPATARSLGVTNSFDPAQNIMGGAKYLRQMLDRFHGDVSMAVAAYNAGPGAVEKYGGVPPYRETRNYVAKVLGYAGSGVSVPAPTGSAASVSNEAGSVLSQAAEGNEASSSMTRDELVDLLMRTYRSGGAQDRESVRLLVEQLLSQNDKEDREGESTVDNYDLKKLALQIDL